MTRPHPHQITQVPPTYATPPPRIPPPPLQPPPPPTPRLLDTLLTALTLASLFAMSAATLTRLLHT
ncbi:hypothetical protein QD712_22575 [Streptomyces acidiscabies]|uniref:hypothetical protein n=1 Tax=Streptomyces acidiscabies TaxID=42234 RepID=UPI0030D3F05A